MRSSTPANPEERCLSTAIETFPEENLGRHRSEERLRVGDDRSDAWRHELGGMDHAKETEAGGAESDQCQHAPRPDTPGRGPPERNCGEEQRHAGGRPAHRGEGQVRCIGDPHRDQGVAGRPEHHHDDQLEGHPDPHEQPF